MGTCPEAGLGSHIGNALILHSKISNASDTPYVILIIRIFFLALVFALPCHADPLLLEIKKAAETGDPAAQKRLGQKYESAMKFSEAEHWYQQAATSGDPDVLWALGRFYCGGKPKMLGSATVPFNPTNAIALLSLAALQGHKRAQHDLAEQYNNGTIVPRDKIRAYQLFRLSGFIVAKVHTDRLILELSSDELSQAEAEVKAFKPKSFKEAFLKIARAHLQLEGIAGKSPKAFAMINGKIVEPAKTVSLEIASIPLEVRCLQIVNRAVTLELLDETVTLVVK